VGDWEPASSTQIAIPLELVPPRSVHPSPVQRTLIIESTDTRPVATITKIRPITTESLLTESLSNETAQAEPKHAWQQSHQPARVILPSEPQYTESVILQPTPVAESPEPISPAPTFQPTSPQSAEAKVVNQLAQKHVAKGFSLGERNAVYAARSEFLQALRMIAQTTDAAHGLAPDDERSCVLALRRASEALTEAADFTRCDGDADELQHFIQSHRTPICQRNPPPTVVAAQQAYFTYALEQLTYAAGSNHMASQALTGLGKCCLLDLSQTSEMLRNSQSLVYQQAAWQTDPRNHLAANELGVLLCRFGQWSEAKRVMLQAVRLHGDASSWQNLATIHDQLGERDLAQLAINESQRWRAASGLPNVYSGVDGTPAVQWVDPRAFGGPPDDAPVKAARVQSNSANSRYR
jgi:tetratricopeptide (TPR) repeat protein